MDEQVKKQPDVELDLDDAKETLVELKDAEEPKKAPSLNVGEVDLGYTNHDNKSRINLKLKLKQDKKNKLII
jgi:hypothetical protein